MHGYTDTVKCKTIIVFSNKCHPADNDLVATVCVLSHPSMFIDTEARYYFICCRSGKYLDVRKSRKTPKKRPHQKETRKINSTCISRMYVDELKDGNISVTYISAHTGHDLGPQELKFLPLPQSTKEAVSMRISQGIPTERILKGYITCSS